MPGKETEVPRLIPVAKWDQYHPWPSPQSIRNRLHAAKGGKDPEFLECIVKVGGRVLIDEAKFFNWIELTSETNR
ncbi:MAG: hypothetical protein FVQ79_12940 [Planctomycetes bacterium]|nr:hypothetical protein [Planctomycetota bacterium]